MFNLKRSSTKLTCHVKAKGLSSKRTAEPGPTDRQERIPHFNQERIHTAKIGLVGAGGINSEIGQGLARKGYGTIRIWDDDIVSLSNYSRQYFFPRDLYKKKALCLPRNLAKDCVYPTTITGYAMRFEEAVAAGMAMDCDVYVFGVDNNATRAFGCQTLYTQAPVVFLGTGPQANNGYVFIQEQGKTCFICLRPDALTDTTQLICAPSSIDY
jgi:molybdopterin/thiamine biosynthesis adenylyltransferase